MKKVIQKPKDKSWKPIPAGNYTVRIVGDYKARITTGKYKGREIFFDATPFRVAIKARTL